MKRKPKSNIGLKNNVWPIRHKQRARIRVVTTAHGGYAKTGDCDYRAAKSQPHDISNPQSLL